MRRRGAAGVLGCAALVGTLASVGCAERRDFGPQAQVTQLPAVVAESEVGEQVDPGELLHLSLALPLRHEDELDRLLADLYDPRSPRFHHFLTVEDFRRRFHPRRREVDKVRSALTPYGLLVDPVAHGAFVGIHGTVANVEAAFGITLRHLRDGAGHSYVGPTEEPVAPDALKVVAVHGLVSGLLPTPLHRPLQQVAPTEAPIAGVRSKRALQAGIDAATLRKSYRVPESMRGRGQTVGLFQLDAFDPNDLVAYAAQNNLPLPHVKVLYLDGAGPEVVDKEIQGEVTLDIEMVMAMAPELDEIRVYQGRWGRGIVGRSYYFNVFNEMANPTLGDRKLVRSLSTSYGYSESDLSPAERRSEHNIFRQMAAQGQSLFSAAGDTGAFDTRQRVAVVDPAIQPYVVAVGGTQLQADGEGNFGQEEAWTGSGGGVSDSWALPAYQLEVAESGRNVASGVWRNAPDVAFNADPNTGFLINVYGGTYRVGGTSAAAPLWAGVLGLINAARAERGLLPLGFFNPTLYRLAAKGDYAALFYDTLRGHNGRYQAGHGYDNVTGWGTPKVERVVSSMARGFARRPVESADW